MNKKLFFGILIPLLIIVISVLVWQLWPATNQPISSKSFLATNNNCATLDIANYQITSELSADLNNDGDTETILIYSPNQPEGECGSELPALIKIFSGNQNCYKEEFSYSDPNYNSADGELIKNLWQNNQDVVQMKESELACGSGVKERSLFFYYKDGQYFFLAGPEITNMDFYFIRPFGSPAGYATLMAEAQWGDNEGHYDPHHYIITISDNTDSGYEKTTKNKYSVDDNSFQAKMEQIKDKIRTVTFLGRKQIDFLDNLGKDALFYRGYKLSRAQILLS